MSGEKEARARAQLAGQPRVTAPAKTPADDGFIPDEDGFIADAAPAAPLSAVPADTSAPSAAAPRGFLDSLVDRLGSQQNVDTSRAAAAGIGSALAPRGTPSIADFVREGHGLTAADSELSQYTRPALAALGIQAPDETAPTAGDEAAEAQARSPLGATVGGAIGSLPQIAALPLPSAGPGAGALERILAGTYGNTAFGAASAVDRPEDLANPERIAEGAGVGALGGFLGSGAGEAAGGVRNLLTRRATAGARGLAGRAPSAAEAAIDARTTADRLRLREAGYTSPEVAHLESQLGQRPAGVPAAPVGQRLPSMGTFPAAPASPLPGVPGPAPVVAPGAPAQAPALPGEAGAGPDLVREDTIAQEPTRAYETSRGEALFGAEPRAPIPGEPSNFLPPEPTLPSAAPPVTVEQEAGRSAGTKKIRNPGAQPAPVADTEVDRMVGVARELGWDVERTPRGDYVLRAPGSPTPEGAPVEDLGTAPTQAAAPAPPAPVAPPHAVTPPPARGGTQVGTGPYREPPPLAPGRTNVGAPPAAPPPGVPAAEPAALARRAPQEPSPLPGGPNGASRGNRAAETADQIRDADLPASDVARQREAGQQRDRAGDFMGEAQRRAVDERGHLLSAQDAMRAVQDALGGLTSSGRQPEIAGPAQDVIDRVRRATASGGLTPEAYATLRDDLTRLGNPEGAHPTPANDAFRRARSALVDRVDNAVELRLGPDERDAYRLARRRFGAMQGTERAAQREGLRSTTNRQVPLTRYLTGLAGFLSGGLGGGAAAAAGNEVLRAGEHSARARGLEALLGMEGRVTGPRPRFGPFRGPAPRTAVGAPLAGRQAAGLFRGATGGTGQRAGTAIVERLLHSDAAAHHRRQHDDEEYRARTLGTDED